MSNAGLQKALVQRGNPDAWKALGALTPERLVRNHAQLPALAAPNASEMGARGGLRGDGVSSDERVGQQQVVTTGSVHHLQLHLEMVERLPRVSARHSFELGLVGWFEVSETRAENGREGQDRAR